MSNAFRIKQGIDLRLTGRPANSLVDLSGGGGTVSVPFAEFEGYKLKVLVKDGDAVRRGQALCQDKKHEDFRITAPVAGVVKSVNYGERRVLLSIDIQPGVDEAEIYAAGGPQGVLQHSAEDAIRLLALAGLLPMIRRRPFDRIADPSVKPKSIFVNAMSTAPFRPNAAYLVGERSAEFQAGLNLLSRIARTFVCHAPADTLFAGFANVTAASFDGPHPAGNTSVHIHHLDALSPGDTVWTVTAAQVLALGEFVATGKVPGTVLVSVGGSGIPEASRRHVKLRVGQSLSDALGAARSEGPQRVILGDVFHGQSIAADRRAGWGATALTVIPDTAERRLLGWALPGAGQFSASRSVLSTWLGGLRREWNLGTGLNGSHRALVMTGIYDAYVPLDIMVDPLIRACLAKDSAEAVNLGLLETAPEDFALCSVVCPSKVDFAEIIQNALKLVEQEGL